MYVHVRTCTIAIYRWYVRVVRMEDRSCSVPVGHCQKVRTEKLGGETLKHGNDLLGLDGQAAISLSH
jgi:hypothetical protein